MRILILHAYSSENAGDGLLVEETMNVLVESVDEAIEFTILASYPETFGNLDATVLRSRPTSRGYSSKYLIELWTLGSYDLVVGVGGGYLRAGHFTESVKMALVHGPQILAAALARVPTIYMPQSIGPNKGIFGKLMKSAVGKIGTVYVRDDRSFRELDLPNVTRIADLAILTGSRVDMPQTEVEGRPVLSIRPIRGRIPPPVSELAAMLGDFDGYSQSDTAGNSDSDAMRSLQPYSMLSREDLMDPARTALPRVVVAVRLHAALMAMRAGHFVIHLAYERKGFGAFEDMGLDEFVHNVNRFEPERVVRQVRLLLSSHEARADYERRCLEGFGQARESKLQLTDAVHRAASNSETKIRALGDATSAVTSPPYRLVNGAPEESA